MKEVMSYLIIITLNCMILIKLVTGVPPVFLQDSDVIPLMRRHLSVQTGAYISLKALPVGQMCLFHLSLFSHSALLLRYLSDVVYI